MRDDYRHSFSGIYRVPIRAPARYLPLVDHRWETYKGLDEMQKGRIREDILDILVGFNTWEFTAEQAIRLSMVIAREGGPEL